MKCPLKHFDVSDNALGAPAKSRGSWGGAELGLSSTQGIRSPPVFSRANSKNCRVLCSRIGDWRNCRVQVASVAHHWTCISAGGWCIGGGRAGVQTDWGIDESKAISARTAAMHSERNIPAMQVTVETFELHGSWGNLHRLARERVVI